MEDRASDLEQTKPKNILKLSTKNPKYAPLAPKFPFQQTILGETFDDVIEYVYRGLIEHQDVNKLQKELSRFGMSEFISKIKPEDNIVTRASKLYTFEYTAKLYELLETAIQLKLENFEFRKKLLSTGYQALIYLSDDTQMGAISLSPTEFKGKNLLGRALERARQKLHIDPFYKIDQELINLDKMIKTWIIWESLSKLPHSMVNYFRGMSMDDIWSTSSFDQYRDQMKDLNLSMSLRNRLSDDDYVKRMIPGLDKTSLIAKIKSVPGLDAVINLKGYENSLVQLIQPHFLSSSPSADMQQIDDFLMQMLSHLTREDLTAFVKTLLDDQYKREKFINDIREKKLTQQVLSTAEKEFMDEFQKTSNKQRRKNLFHILSKLPPISSAQQQQESSIFESYTMKQLLNWLNNTNQTNLLTKIEMNNEPLDLQELSTKQSNAKDWNIVDLSYLERLKQKVDKKKAEKQAKQNIVEERQHELFMLDQDEDEDVEVDEDEDDVDIELDDEEKTQQLLQKMKKAIVKKKRNLLHKEIAEMQDEMNEDEHDEDDDNEDDNEIVQLKTKNVRENLTNFMTAMLMDKPGRNLVIQEDMYTFLPEYQVLKTKLDLMNEIRSIQGRLGSQLASNKPIDNSLVRALVDALNKLYKSDKQVLKDAEEKFKKLSKMTEQDLNQTVNVQWLTNTQWFGSKGAKYKEAQKEFENVRVAFLRSLKRAQRLLDAINQQKLVLEQATLADLLAKTVVSTDALEELSADNIRFFREKIITRLLDYFKNKILLFEHDDTEVVQTLQYLSELWNDAFIHVLKRFQEQFGELDIDKTILQRLRQDFVNSEFGKSLVHHFYDRQIKRKNDLAFHRFSEEFNQNIKKFNDENQIKELAIEYLLRELFHTGSDIHEISDTISQLAFDIPDENIHPEQMYRYDQLKEIVQKLFLDVKSQWTKIPNQFEQTNFETFMNQKIDELLKDTTFYEDYQANQNKAVRSRKEINATIAEMLPKITKIVKSYLAQKKNLIMKNDPQKSTEKEHIFEKFYAYTFDDNSVLSWKNETIPFDEHFVSKEKSMSHYVRPEFVEKLEEVLQSVITALGDSYNPMIHPVVYNRSKSALSSFVQYKSCEQYVDSHLMLDLENQIVKLKIYKVKADMEQIRKSHSLNVKYDQSTLANWLNVFVEWMITTDNFVVYTKWIDDVLKPQLNDTNKENDPSLKDLFDMFAETLIYYNYSAFDSRNQLERLNDILQQTDLKQKYSLKLIIHQRNVLAMRCLVVLRDRFSPYQNRKELFKNPQMKLMFPYQILMLSYGKELLMETTNDNFLGVMVDHVDVEESWLTKYVVGKTTDVSNQYCIFLMRIRDHFLLSYSRTPFKNLDDVMKRSKKEIQLILSSSSNIGFSESQSSFLSTLSNILLDYAFNSDGQSVELQRVVDYVNGKTQELIYMIHQFQKIETGVMNKSKLDYDTASFVIRKLYYKCGLTIPVDTPPIPSDWKRDAKQFAQSKNIQVSDSILKLIWEYVFKNAVSVGFDKTDVQFKSLTEEIDEIDKTLPKIVTVYNTIEMASDGSKRKKFSLEEYLKFVNDQRLDLSPVDKQYYKMCIVPGCKFRAQYSSAPNQNAPLFCETHMKQVQANRDAWIKDGNLKSIPYPEVQFIEELTFPFLQKVYRINLPFETLPQAPTQQERQDLFASYSWRNHLKANQPNPLNVGRSLDIPFTKFQTALDQYVIVEDAAFIYKNKLYRDLLNQRAQLIAKRNHLLLSQENVKSWPSPVQSTTIAFLKVFELINRRKNILPNRSSVQFVYRLLSVNQVFPLENEPIESTYQELFDEIRNFVARNYQVDGSETNPLFKQILTYIIKLSTDPINKQRIFYFLSSVSGDKLSVLELYQRGMISEMDFEILGIDYNSKLWGLAKSRPAYEPKPVNIVTLLNPVQKYIDMENKVETEEVVLENGAAEEDENDDEENLDPYDESEPEDFSDNEDDLE